MTRPEMESRDTTNTTHATDSTQVLNIPDASPPRDLAAERVQRDRALGKVPRVSGDGSTPLPVKRTTDRPLGAFGLFVLRLVTAAIAGLYGFQTLTRLTATRETLARTVIPSPNIVAIIVAVAEIAIAVALLFGVLTRVAGLAIMVITIGALVFVLWGVANPLQAGRPGFTGEFELLLAAVGFLLLTLGAGAWSIDAAVRRRRQRAKQGY